MTWSVFDDGAPKHPKARAAGNEAWGLWAAAVMYCNRWLTDGHVTLAALANDCLPEPIAPARARKLAEKLCQAKIRPDGVGMFAASGTDAWDVHDFLEWNKSKAEVESKRAADRARKRGGGTGGGEPEPPGKPPGVPTDSARTSQGIPSGKNSASAPRAGARGRSDPPSPPGPPVPSPPLGDGGAEATGRIRCPMPVPVPDDTLGGLDLGVGLPVPLARAFLVPWSAKQNAKAGDLRTLDAWCATAVAALCGEWSDDKAAFRRTAGADPADDPELASRARQKADAEAAAGERVRRDREALAARLGASAPSLEAAKDTVRNLASGDRP